MEIILAHAHTLMYTILALMPSRYQRDNLEAIRTYATVTSNGAV